MRQPAWIMMMAWGALAALLLGQGYLLGVLLCLISMVLGLRIVMRVARALTLGGLSPARCLPDIGKAVFLLLVAPALISLMIALYG